MRNSTFSLLCIRAALTIAMSYLDYTNDASGTAFLPGFLDVDLTSPAAAAQGLQPGVTSSAVNELAGGFPSTINPFPSTNYSALGAGGINNAGSTNSGPFNVGDPLFAAAAQLDMALGQPQQHQQQVHQPLLHHQQPHQQPPHTFHNQTMGGTGMFSTSNYPNSRLSQPGQWRPMGQAVPTDMLRTTPSPAPSATNSLPGSNASTHMPERACLVCADEALGRHFGVLTCEACKSFFRRSVRHSAQYFCRYNRVCHVAKQSRNKCQYCRYQKCLRVGMQPDAVQEERNPATGKVCGSRKEDDSPIGSPVSSVQQVAGSVVAASPVSSWGMAASVPAGSKNITTLLSRSPTDGLGSATAQLTLPALLDAERAWEDDKETKTPITTPADFGDIVATTKDQLFLSIAWAKNVPAFSSLHVDDQALILKSVWNELLTLQLAFRASPFENTLILGSGQLLYRDRGNPDICRLVGRFIDEIVTPCKVMGLEMAELVSMKAIVLFNPDCPKLLDAKKIEQLQEQCMETLDEYCRSRFPEQKLRFSKILLRLSAVRSITTETRDYIIQHRQHSNVQVDSFVLEMLGVEVADEPPNSA